MSKIALVVSDHPVVIARKLRGFRKKDVIKELGRKALGLDKTDAEDIIGNMYKEGLAITSDNKTGIQGLHRAFGYLLACDIKVSMISEEKALKKAKKWFFEGIKGAEEPQRTISRNSLLHRIDLEKHTPKEFARLIKAVLEEEA